MKIITALIILVSLFPAVLLSQNEENSNTEEEDDAFYQLLEKGEMSASLDFSIGTDKRKGAKNLAKSSVDIKDYYIPYLSLSTGLFERLTLGADFAYRISKISISVNNPITNNQISGSKSISGLDIITLWGSLGIIKEHKMRPSIVFNSYFYLPKTGKQEFQIDNLGFFPEISFHNTFGDNFDLYYSVGVTWDGTYDYPVYSFVLNPGYYLNDNFYINAELWNSFNLKSSPDNYITLDLSYTGEENFSIDLYGGTTFQKPNNNLFGGVTFGYWFTAF